MQQQQRRTKQGVPDLNGPAMNGRSYNGRAEGHRHNPSTSMISELEMRTVTIEDAHYGPRKETKHVRVHYCAFCLAELDVSVD